MWSEPIPSAGCLGQKSQNATKQRCWPEQFQKPIVCCIITWPCGFQKNLWVADMEKAWVRFTPHSNTQPRSFQLEVNSIPLQAAVRLGSAVWHCEGEVITFWSSPATQRLFRRCRQCPPLIDHSHQRNVRPWTQLDKLTKRQRTFREGSFN